MLKTLSSAIEAEMLRGRLEADGVHCALQGDKAASVVGDVNRLNINWSSPLGGTTLLVHQSDLAHAREALRQIEGTPTWVRRSATPAMRVIQIAFAANFSSALLFYVLTQLGALITLVALIAILILVWKLGA